MRIALLVVLLCLSVSWAEAKPKSISCSWEKCPTWKRSAAKTVKVHLIPHSHQDFGWLKTADQYYYGSNKKAAEGGVQYVYDTVFNELQENPRRTFTFCETAFFWKWWNNRPAWERYQFKKLVTTGQIEWVGGGWVQEDEATTHYISMIDQMTLGLDKLNETFQRCGVPRVAWQIDPFGHSREQANIFAQMSFDAVFFSRLHYLEKTSRLTNKTLNFLWKASDDLPSSQILGGAFYGESYGPPTGFCFDELCKDDPIMDDDRLEDYNADKMINSFIAYVEEQAKKQSFDHVMILMGSDFTYGNADTWYINMDKIIHYVNARLENGSAAVEVAYSTPSCYVRAFQGKKVRLQEKSDDFFPYASGPNSYWTGFYTSRPTVKGFVRQSSSFLQMCKQLDAVAYLGPADFGELDVFRMAQAMLQHHDAVTGTARQNVTYDYNKQLSKGLMECQQVVNDALVRLLPKTPGIKPPEQYFCPLSNISVCEVVESAKKFAVTFFNGGSGEANFIATTPLYGSGALVIGPNGTTVVSQVHKTVPTAQLQYKKRAPYQLHFTVSVPPVGFATYFVTVTEGDVNKVMETPSSRRKESAVPVFLENELLRLEFNSTTGLLSSVKLLKENLELPVSQNFYFYRSAVASNATGRQASGAYVFRPNGTEPTRLNAADRVQLQKTTGPLFDEIRQSFGNWSTQIVRVFKGAPYVEFEWTIGPVPFEDKLGKEVISRFDTDIKSEGKFYTDSNGRQIITRRRNYNPSYQYNNTEPVAANYYPVNSRIHIKDPRVQLTVLTDRSQGGASLKDGSLELMVHRRMFELDSFGVGEPLNETGVDGRGLVVRGRHWLLVQSTADRPLARQLAMRMFHSPKATFSPLKQNATVQTYQRDYKTSFTGLASALPENVHLLTLEQWQGNKLLIRLEHIFQTGEDSKLSMPVSIDFSKLFATVTLTRCDEMNLAANRVIKADVMVVSDDDLEKAAMLETNRTKRRRRPLASAKSGRDGRKLRRRHSTPSANQSMYLDGQFQRRTVRCRRR